MNSFPPPDFDQNPVVDFSKDPYWYQSDWYDKPEKFPNILYGKAEYSVPSMKNGKLVYKTQIHHVIYLQYHEPDAFTVLSYPTHLSLERALQRLESSDFPIRLPIQFLLFYKILTVLKVDQLFIRNTASSYKSWIQFALAMLYTSIIRKRYILSQDLGIYLKTEEHGELEPGYLIQMSALTNAIVPPILINEYSDSITDYWHLDFLKAFSFNMQEHYKSHETRIENGKLFPRIIEENQHDILTDILYEAHAVAYCLNQNPINYQLRSSSRVYRFIGNPDRAWENLFTIAEIAEYLTGEELDFILLQDLAQNPAIQTILRTHADRRASTEDSIRNAPFRYSQIHPTNPELEPETAISLSSIIEQNLAEVYESEAIPASGNYILSDLYLSKVLKNLEATLQEQADKTTDDISNLLEAEQTASFLLNCESIRLIIKPNLIILSVIYKEDELNFTTAFITPSVNSLRFTTTRINFAILALIASSIWRDFHTHESRPAMHKREAPQAETKAEDRTQKKPKDKVKHIVRLPRVHYINWGSEREREEIQAYTERIQRSPHRVFGHRRQLPSHWKASEQQRQLYFDLTGKELPANSTWVSEYATGDAGNVEIVSNGLRRTLSHLVHLTRNLRD